AHAQQAGLAVGPAIFEVSLEPGVAHAQKIRLKNLAPTALPVTVRAQPLQPQPDVRLTEDFETSTFDASQWFSFDESDIILRPGEERTVTVTIEPPATAEPGGHYATILFTPLAVRGGVPSSSTHLASEVGSQAF